MGFVSRGEQQASGREEEREREEGKKHSFFFLFFQAGQPKTSFSWSDSISGVTLQLHKRKLCISFPSNKPH